jgi:hypothetical protein
MQKEKIDIPFLKYWKFNRLDKVRINKIIEWFAECIDNLCALFSRSKNNNISNNYFQLKNIIPFVFSGFSIIFIGYLIMNIIINYPPREIGISL